MAARTFWDWYDKELPSGDDPFTFQKAWDASRDAAISPEEFETRMKDLFINEDDPELNHKQADTLMCSILKELGYEAGVKIFEEGHKYYV